MDLSTDAPLDDAGSMASAALALTTDGEVIFSGAWGDLSPRLTPRVALPSVPRRWGPAPPALAFAPPRGPRGTASLTLVLLPRPFSRGPGRRRVPSPPLCVRGHCFRQRPGPAYYYSRAPANPEADSPPGRLPTVGATVEKTRWCTVSRAHKSSGARRSALSCVL